MEARPLDMLNNSRDKRVVVELKNSKQYIGALKAFDIHINVVLEGAEELAKQDRFQFEWWALGLVGARPIEQKKRC